jgi:glycosyltransferase involved in cell wall biosynthesis
MQPGHDGKSGKEDCGKIVSADMKNACISIVIPMYNASRYIIETLESVRNQTYRDWELIIVDDGSNDLSAELVQEFTSRHPGIAKLLFHQHKENRGTSASRNLGLRYAQGELICFLDADDVWHPNFLDFFIHVFDRYPEISMAYAPALLWHTSDMGRDNSKDAVQRLGIKANRIVNARTLFKLFLVGDGDTPSPSGVMIRHNVLSSVGGWEEMFRGMYDDQALYSKLLLRGIAVYVTDQCLYRYRQHEGSICSMAAPKETQSPDYRKVYLEWLRQYLAQSGQLSEDLSIILTEHLWHIQFHKETDLLPSAAWVKKIKRVRSFIALLLKQKNVLFMLKLGWRIVSRELLYKVRAIGAFHQYQGIGN